MSDRDIWLDMTYDWSTWRAQMPTLRCSLKIKVWNTTCWSLWNKMTNNLLHVGLLTTGLLTAAFMMRLTMKSREGSRISKLVRTCRKKKKYEWWSCQFTRKIINIPFAYSSYSAFVVVFLCKFEKQSKTNKDRRSTDSNIVLGQWLPFCNARPWYSQLHCCWDFKSFGTVDIFVMYQPKWLKFGVQAHFWKML